ncbi:MAG: UDP-N-acetylmuramoyl-L-alanyl-D-glutamate--2,6-diaminopimelate ligase [Ignavibacteria bacterium]|nr:UDP-N-acetylmuramoyl-L-alanyl-D-glutamate--2,6-diaminopimelate ligase [Ignavibacteria bacterium]
MLLTEILNKVQVIQLVGNPDERKITGIEYNSQNVGQGSIFVAIKGFKTDGHHFIQEALNKNAAAIVVEDNSSIPDSAITNSNAVKILVPDSRKTLAEISNLFYSEPSKKINLIGITGTNGKTTTAYFVKNIFETAGNKVGLIGTIMNYIGEEVTESKLTTPESKDLNRMLVEMNQTGCKYVVIEVSSHSLSLRRVHGINFSSAIFTNITAEHLDFHQNFENYLSAKKLLFDTLAESSTAIYNADDLHGIDVLKDCNAVKFSFGRRAEFDFRISDVSFDLTGTTFNLNFQNKTHSIKTSLVGDFNSYNAASSFAVAKLNGLDDDLIVEGIKSTLQVPGRFEVLTNGTRKVVIDYSHTPDSLEKALLVIRKLTSKDNRVLTVFGCGGNRDKQKRPVMGKIATELSDKVILTSDNPRFENPEMIIEDIKSGIIKDNYKVIENREEAIANAIYESGNDAVILIAGKGHEEYQEIDGVRKHFSDRQTAKSYMGI